MSKASSLLALTTAAMALPAFSASQPAESTVSIRASSYNEEDAPQHDILTGADECYEIIDPRKLLAQLSKEEIESLVSEGEHSTWPVLAQIRISSKIGQTLDDILDIHREHNVRQFYRKRS